MTATAKITPDIASTQIDCKRTSLPFHITSACPTCGVDKVVDLTQKGQHYISFPRVVSSPSEYRPGNKVYFYCDEDDCDTEWQIMVAILVSMEVLT